MNRQKLIEEIRKKKSCLCIGLDTDRSKLPAHLTKSPQSVLNFNKKIIDATRDMCVAYKINTAFYESMGAEGWSVMEQTAQYISDSHFKIADAKRGDIGNTAQQYAKAFFERMNFDAITISPYMGSDSILPFLEHKGKWIIILGLTSNPGGSDFQKLQSGDQYLWENVLKQTSVLGNDQNTMYVVGATHPEEFEKVRKIIPNHFLLVPGVGAQGGKISEVMERGKNSDVGLLINVSRSILFAGEGQNFDTKAREAAKGFRKEMMKYI